MKSMNKLRNLREIGYNKSLLLANKALPYMNGTPPIYGYIVMYITILQVL